MGVFPIGMTAGGRTCVTESIRIPRTWTMLQIFDLQASSFKLQASGCGNECEGAV